MNFPLGDLCPVNLTIVINDQGGNANGDYYVVETDGRLGLYDGDGRWSLLQRESP